MLLRALIGTPGVEPELDTNYKLAALPLSYAPSQINNRRYVR